MQENTDNQIIQSGEIIPQSTPTQKPTTPPLTPHHSFVRRNIKKLLLIFAAVLLLESLWAINFVRSSKTASISETASQQDTSQNENGREQPILTPIATMYLDPQDNTISLGNEFELAIVINTEDRKINGIDSIITYNPSTLTVVDGYTDAPGVQVKPGNIYNSLLINSVDPLEGKITLTGSRLSKETPAFQGTGNFALLRFKAIKIGTTEINILFDQTSTKTSNIVESESSASILTGTGNATIQITQ